MMKCLQKKLVLAHTATLDANARYPTSGPYSLSTILLNWLRNLNKLWHRIDIYLSARNSTHRAEKEIARPEGKKTPFMSNTEPANAISWAPVIKTKSPRIASPVNRQSNEHNAATLAGQTVLCVGGRNQLYPAYNRLTEHMGGRLITFRGNPNDQLNDLPRLLEKTDLIICPIDCVNHEAFIIVKLYCTLTGKPCVLLERSESASFQNGISTLSRLFSRDGCMPAA